MREDASTSKFAVTAGLLVFFAVAVNALIGVETIGIHTECMDNIDNDLDTSIDENDLDCAIYPYADGNGESFTPEDERRTGESYSPSNAWEWVVGLEPPQIDPCVQMYSPVTQLEAYNAQDYWIMFEGVCSDGI